MNHIQVMFQKGVSSKLLTASRLSTKKHSRIQNVCTPKWHKISLKNANFESTIDPDYPERRGRLTSKRPRLTRAPPKSDNRELPQIAQTTISAEKRRSLGARGRRSREHLLLGTSAGGESRAATLSSPASAARPAAPPPQSARTLGRQSPAMDASWTTAVHTTALATARMAHRHTGLRRAAATISSSPSSPTAREASRLHPTAN